MHALIPARALLSVSDKTGIVELAQALQRAGTQLLSTGGTATLLRAAGLNVTEVAEHTGHPEMMDGRVKTLHPKIHGGILALRGDAAHEASMRDHAIAPIDLVVVNLYPFEQTLACGAAYDETVEQIDIGGPAMVRSAAKNHAHVVVVVDPADYAEVMAALASGGISYALRARLAARAFARTSSYDMAIAGWLAQEHEPQGWPSRWAGGQLRQSLRYGENPHQRAAFYALPDAPHSLAQAEQLQGKELSYNNLNDTDAAWQLVCEFDEPAVVIVKHANPCGVALGHDITQAYSRALACDPVSAFGGIIAANRTLDATWVQALGSLFAEVIIVPDITDEAKTMLAAKKNLRVLITGGLLSPTREQLQVKSLAGGYLVQSADNALLGDSGLQCATQAAPDAQQQRDMLFAFTVCKHVKSNAIVIAKDGATLGIGAGQMSRVDSVRLACNKAQAAGLSVQGAVLASDAFFPFDDNVHEAASHGIAALIQPGGSVRDGEVVAAANTHHMAMLLTGMRHFKH